MIFQLNLQWWRCLFWTKSSTRVIGTLHSPSTTWLLPEVVPSYGRVNIIVLIFVSQPAWYICVYFLNTPELDDTERLAWWRVAFTIFTSYVIWNHYTLHTRCFFWPLWRLQLGGCGDTVRREEVHHSSGCAPYQRILSACAPFVRPPILQPSAHRGRPPTT